MGPKFCPISWVFVNEGSNRRQNFLAPDSDIIIHAQYGVGNEC